MGFGELAHQIIEKEKPKERFEELPEQARKLVDNLLLAHQTARELTGKIIDDHNNPQKNVCQSDKEFMTSLNKEIEDILHQLKTLGYEKVVRDFFRSNPLQN